MTSTTPPSRNLQRYLPPLGVALLVLLATAFASWTAYSVYGSRDRERFEDRVSEIADAIESRLDSYLVVLHSASALLAGGEVVDPKRFRALIETLDLPARYYGLTGIGFVARVMAADRPAFEENLRVTAPAGFSIRPEGTRREYHPIVALEPLDEKSSAAIGLDLATDPEPWAAMESARDSGLPAASGAVQGLAGATRTQLGGFVVFLPVYRAAGAPADAAARRAALLGFVFSPVDTAEFVTASVPWSNGQVAFEIFDAQGDEHPFYVSDAGETASGSQPTYRARRKINLAGRDWTIVARTTPLFDEASRVSIVPYVLGGGLLISMLLFAAMRAQADARHDAERNAEVLQALLLARRESEARRAAILESSLDAVVAMDESGRITEFNRAAEQAFGFTRAELLGHDLFATIIPDSYREELRGGFAHYLQVGGRSFLGQRIEAGARRRDGGEFAAEVTVSEIRLDSGREFTAHIRDVTERKQNEDTLRLERETVETLLRVTSSFAAKLDLQALIQDVIDAATGAAGAELGAFFYSGPLEEDREGESIYAVAPIERALFRDSSLPRPSALPGATLSDREMVRIDDLTVDERHARNGPRADLSPGHPSVRSYLAVPVVTGSGTLLGTIVLGHPLAARFNERHESVVRAVAAQAAVSLDKASLYRAAQEARQAAELANRAKDEFLATLSHELRTPLTAILGWCQLLTRGKRTPAEIARGLERIESSAQAQTRLISDLLDVSRIVSGKLRLEVQSLDIESVIVAAIEAIRPAAAAKAIDVCSVIDPLAVVVAGDASRLQQVFWNLLSNAVKFTPKGGRIEVRLERRGGHALVSVSDDGCGIRPQDLGYIFDRFRQVDSSTTRRSGGLGLGLAIVRHLVELHGGMVRAESAGENLGATFCVSLPLLVAARQPTVDDVTESAREHAKAGAELRLGTRPLAGLRVLVVDDDEETRELIKTILEEVGADVCAVPSVNRAVEALDSHGPHVLVSDIAMPDRDGYDLIRYIRGLAESDGGRLPALALTAFARSEDCRRALLAGFQMHAAKPVEPAELVAMVASLARRPVAPDPQWH